MASINGFSLKNVKSWVGREGTAFQGNLYLGSKKIAFWSQDGNGDIEDALYMEDGFSEEKLRSVIKKVNKDKATHGISSNGTPYTFEYSLERLTYDLLNLKDDEKDFKKAIKDGYGGSAVAGEGYTSKTFFFPPHYLRFKGEKLKEELSKDLKKDLNEIFRYTSNEEDKKFTVYRDANDFNIGKKISLDDIKKRNT